MIKQILHYSFITVLFIIYSQSSLCQSRSKSDFSEPISNPLAHDPAVAFENNVYYLFTTGEGIHCMSSTDLKNWQPIGPCLDSLPEWIIKELPDASLHLWAPDIIFHGGLWHLFYSCSAFGRNTSVIGHAVNSTLDPNNPNYKWIDKGMIVQSIPYRDNWNAIDPNVIIDDDDNAWLTFGSFWGGIKIVQLTKDLSHIAEPQIWRTLAKRHSDIFIDEAEAGNAAIEAPFIIRKNNWYYLFVSIDYCCRGVNSDYKVIVGRSRNVSGPYFDMNGQRLDHDGGTIFIVGDKDKWAAVGHCAVYSFGEKDYFFAHAYEMKKGTPRLLVREILWENDWPYLK